MGIKDFLQGRFIHHPLHPMLVHFPVGLWVGSLIFDILYFANRSAIFAGAAYYCILFGLIGAVIAVIPGLAEYVDIPSQTRAKHLATQHMIINFSVAVLFLLNFLSRMPPDRGAPQTVEIGPFVLSIVCVVLLGVSGFLGGLLVYERGIGQRPPREERGAGERGRERTAA